MTDDSFGGFHSVTAHALADRGAFYAKAAQRGRLDVLWGMLVLVLVLAGMAVEIALVFDARSVPHLNIVTGVLPSTLFWLVLLLAVQGGFTLIGIEMIARVAWVRSILIGVIALGTAAFAISLMILKGAGDLSDTMSLLGGVADALSWVADQANLPDLSADQNLVHWATYGAYLPYLVLPAILGLLSRGAVDRIRRGWEAIRVNADFVKEHAEIERLFDEGGRHLWNEGRISADVMLTLMAAATQEVQHHLDMIDDVIGLAATRRHLHVDGEQAEAAAGILEDMPDLRAHFMKDPEGLERKAIAARKRLENGFIRDIVAEWVTLRGLQRQEV